MTSWYKWPVTIELVESKLTKSEVTVHFYKELGYLSHDKVKCKQQQIIQITVLDSKSEKRFDQFRNFLGLYVVL